MFFLIIKTKITTFERCIFLDYWTIHTDFFSDADILLSDDIIGYELKAPITIIFKSEGKALILLNKSILTEHFSVNNNHNPTYRENNIEIEINEDDVLELGAVSICFKKINFDNLEDDYELDTCAESTFLLKESIEEPDKEFFISKIIRSADSNQIEDNFYDRAFWITSFAHTIFILMTMAFSIEIFTYCSILNASEERLADFLIIASAYSNGMELADNFEYIEETAEMLISSSNRVNQQEMTNSIFSVKIYEREYKFVLLQSPQKDSFYLVGVPDDAWYRLPLPVLVIPSDSFHLFRVYNTLNRIDYEEISHMILNSEMLIVSDHPACQLPRYADVHLEIENLFKNEFF